VGPALAARLSGLTIAVLDRGNEMAGRRGIMIADTKVEFGLDLPADASWTDADPDSLVLADEVLTPDSSRFWPADQYRVGQSQPSFDKQYVRDFLETLDWDKSPPGPELPAEVRDGTAARYRDAYRRITGAGFESYLAEMGVGA